MTEVLPGVGLGPVFQVPTPGARGTWRGAPARDHREARVSSAFGEVRNEGRTRHMGADIAYASRTELTTLAPGRVTVADDTPDDGAGKNVKIEHIPPELDALSVRGWETRYLHLDELAVERGDYVRPGDLIGWSGNTGHVFGRRPDGTIGPPLGPDDKTTGAHLHLSVLNPWSESHQRAIYVDPAIEVESNPAEPWWYLEEEDATDLYLASRGLPVRDGTRNRGVQSVEWPYVYYLIGFRRD